MAEFKGHAADGGRGRREGDTERLQLVQEAVEVGGVCGWVTCIWREGRRKLLTCTKKNLLTCTLYMKVHVYSTHVRVPPEAAHFSLEK